MGNFFRVSIYFLLALNVSRSWSVPCSPVAQTLSVITTADALSLAEAINCTGGIFDVEWVGRVTLSETIRVFGKTTLAINGVDPSSAVIDGAGRTQLLKLQNSSLTMSGIALTRGSAPYGGAIEANEALLSISNCILTDNDAVMSGGSVALYNGARLNVTGDSTLANSSAGSGGAVYLSSSEAFLQGRVVFSGNTASDYGGAMVGLDGSTIAITGEETSFVGNAAGIHGGAINFFIGGTLLVTGNTGFHQNTAGGDGGAISLNEESEMRQEGEATFTNNVAVEYGGAIEASTFCPVTLGGGVKFEKNTAGYGGAVAFYKSSSLNFFGSTSFVNNSASAGGAAEIEDNCNVSLSGDTKFEMNTATSGGAGLYSLGNVAIRIENAVFESNTVLGGNGGATFLGSSGMVTEAVEFVGCSFLNNVAIDGSGGAVFISSGYVDIVASNFTENTAGTDGGAISSSALRASTIDCNFWRNSGAEAPGISNALYLEAINSSFAENERFCDDDLQYVSLISGSRSDYSCSGCSSVVNCDFEDPLTLETCIDVPSNTGSPGATHTVTSLSLDPGYWRSSNQSVEIVECYNDAACRGGATEYCETGYEGPYCAVCAEEYTETLRYTCSMCSGTTAAVTLGVAAIVVLALVIALGWGTFFLITGVRIGTAEDREVAPSRFRRLVPTRTLKIIIVSWQITTEFASVASVTYPNVYDRFLTITQLFTFDLGWLFSTGCHFNTTFYHRLVVVTTIPLVLTGILRATYSMACRRHYGDKNGTSAVLRRHTSVFLVLAFLLYSTISSAIFQTFACDELDDGREYLRADHRLNCDTSTHLAFMVYAGLMIGVYPVGIPLVFAIVLWRKRSRLTVADRDDDVTIEPMKELWQPYRKDVYFYEIIECLRRVTLSGVVVFIFPNSTAQIVVTFLIALFFYVVSEALHPYDQWQERWVYRIGHLLTLLGVYLALLPRIDTEDEQRSNEVLLGWALVITNIVLIVGVIVQSAINLPCYTGMSAKTEPSRRRPSLGVVSFVEELPYFETNAQHVSETCTVLR